MKGRVLVVSWATRKQLWRTSSEMTERRCPETALCSTWIGATDRFTFPRSRLPRSHFLERRLIGIGAAVTHRPLPHHRAYGSVHGGSRWLRRHFLKQ